MKWFIIKHQLYDFLRFVGMRHRLRCPHCGAYGTWKPHGGWFDASKKSGRRWICKWCGIYVERPYNKGEIITVKAFIDRNVGCWRLEQFYEMQPQDKIVPKDYLRESLNYSINPWAD
jgi:hypothetical protein